MHVGETISIMSHLPKKKIYFGIKWGRTDAAIQCQHYTMGLSRALHGIGWFNQDCFPQAETESGNGPLVTVPSWRHRPVYQFSSSAQLAAPQ